MGHKQWALQMFSTVLFLLSFHERSTFIHGFSPSTINGATRTTSGPIATFHGRKANDIHQLFMAAEAREQLASNEDSEGKVIVGRSLFRFSHAESSIPSVQTPYTIEERQYFSVGPANSLQPITDRTVVFRQRERDGDVQVQESESDNGIPHVTNKIGPALFTIAGLKDEGSIDGMVGCEWDSRYAMALYCMEHTEIINGEGLEVACGVGTGGILSIIGAGLATGAEIFSDENNDLVSPVPSALSRIIVSDPNEELLQTCIENLDMSANFPESKAVFGKLDWNMGVPESLKDQFNFMLGCDCAISSTSIEALANLVAYTLKKDNGTFLHVGPQDRETLYDLQLLLRMQHGMNAKMREIVVERIDLSPVMMDNLEEVEARMRSEDDGSYVEYIDMHTSRYSALIVDHNGHHDEEELDTMMKVQRAMATRIEKEAEAEKRVVVEQEADEEVRKRVVAEQDAARIEEDAKEEERLRLEAEQEAARIEEEKEEVERLRLEAARIAEEEEVDRLRLEAEQEAARIAEEEEEIERLRLEAEQEAARIEEEEVERLRLEAEQEAARIEEEEAERLRLEAEQEAARIEEEEVERLRLEADQVEIDQQAARIEEEEVERLRLEAEQEAARIKEEVERLRLEAEQEAVRIEEEEVERLRLEAEQEATRIEEEEEVERLRLEAAIIKEEEAERLRLEAKQEPARIEEEEVERLDTEQVAASVQQDVKAGKTVSVLVNIGNQKERGIIAETKQRGLFKQKLAYGVEAARMKEEERLRIVAARINVEEEEEERLSIKAEQEATRIKAEDLLRIEWARLEEEAKRLRIEVEQDEVRIKTDSERLRIISVQEVAAIKEEAEEIAASMQTEMKQWRVISSSEAVRSSSILETNQRNLLTQKLAYDTQAMTRRRIERANHIVERSKQKQKSNELNSVYVEGNKAVAFLAKTRLLADMITKRQAKVKVDREDRRKAEEEERAARKLAQEEARAARKVAQEKSRAAMKKLPCSIPFPNASMRLVNGRRCVLIPSRKRENRNEFESDGDISVPPPIVILGGMAQYIESWQHHFHDLSRERDLLMIEYLGSGLGYEHDSESSTSEDEYYSDVTLARQAEEFESIVNEFFQIKQVDIIGFSLGARIALAIIARNPTLIRNAHLTGISAEKDVMAKNIFASWADMLSTDGSSSVKSFAWSILMASFTKQFIERNDQERVSMWVDQICDNNRKLGLLRLLEQTKDVDPIDFVDAVKASQTNIQLAVGDEDVLSTPKQVERLNKKLGLGNSVLQYKGCGHAVMNENPRQWQKDVLAFLNGA